MKYKHETEGEITIVKLSGNIMGGPDFEKYHSYIKDLISGGNLKFVFNFEKVGWISSNGIGIICSAYNSIKNAEGRLVICCTNTRVASTYYVLKLDSLFDNFDKCEDAVSSLSN